MRTVHAAGLALLAVLATACVAEIQDEHMSPESGTAATTHTEGAPQLDQVAKGNSTTGANGGGKPQPDPWDQGNGSSNDSTTPAPAGTGTATSSTPAPSSTNNGASTGDPGGKPQPDPWRQVSGKPQPDPWNGANVGTSTNPGVTPH